MLNARAGVDLVTLIRLHNDYMLNVTFGNLQIPIHPKRKVYIFKDKTRKTTKLVMVRSKKAKAKSRNITIK